MWKAVYDSVLGTSHHNSGLPCQDYCRVLQVMTPAGLWLIACSADGAGSASHSEEGARLACDTFVSVIERDLCQEGSMNLVSDGLMLSWCDELRAAIESRSLELCVETRQLACTFVAAVVTENAALFLQIGDGAVVTLKEDGYQAVFWPQSGEFANTTHFLTDHRYQESIQWLYVEERIDEIAIFTDGLERLILRFNDRSVHEPFLLPLFTALRTAEDAAVFFEPLRRFLDSPQVNERTDDDKTLILLTRKNTHNSEDAVL